MKISFLVPDIAGPVLGPVTVLAKTLQRHFDVEIVGPDLGRGVCPMYRGSFDYTVVPSPRLYRFPDFFREAAALGRALTGDVVIAVKAFADTVPVALRERRRRGCRVAVYLDEWDGALVRQMPRGEVARRWLTQFHHPLEEIYHPLVERMLKRTDLVISTSTFLQRRFGGAIVHMGVDTEFFRPRPEAQTAALRRLLALDGTRLIVFGGVVRPHKGIESILDALVRLADPSVRLLVVGPETEHLAALRANPAYTPYLACTGAQPKERMPEFLALADLIVLPLQDTLFAASQMPCKIFEAMAMGKPVIGSAVSDLPLVLDGCGAVVPPGDAVRLADEIRRVLADPAEAKRMGDAARETCIRLYSREQTERQLVSLMEQLKR